MNNSGINYGSAINSLIDNKWLTLQIESHLYSDFINIEVSNLNLKSKQNPLETFKPFQGMVGGRDLVF